MLQPVQAPADSYIEIFDQRATGLALRVHAHGRKSWYFHYTRQTDRSRRRMAFGTFPAMGLEAARRRTHELRNDIEHGLDPATEKRDRKSATTFKELAELRLKTDTGIGEATKANYRQALNSDVYKAFGAVPANEVTADMVARVLDTVEDRGAAAYADRVRSAVGSTFKWAMKRRRAGVVLDPTAGLGKRAPATVRSRVLDSGEMAKLWLGLSSDAAPLTKPMQFVVKLAILTGQRRADVCGARVAELDLDSPAPTWIIPSDTKPAGKVVKGRTKNRQEQVVPLSRQAADLWREALALAQGSDYAFPADLARVKTKGTPRTPHINPENVSKAMRRFRVELGVDDVRLHDMRRSVATWCGNNGIRPDVIDRILNHVPQDVTRRHYNFAGMDGLVLQALQAWADHVWEIAGPTAEP